MYTKLVTTDKSIPAITNTYRLCAEFDEGETVKIHSDDTQYIINLINMYDEYMDNLSTDWNSWCNPTEKSLQDLVQKYFPSEEGDLYGFLSEVWSDDHEYDRQYFARVTHYTVTYLDSAGIEFEVVPA